MTSIMEHMDLADIGIEVVKEYLKKIKWTTIGKSIVILCAMLKNHYGDEEYTKVFSMVINIHYKCYNKLDLSLTEIYKSHYEGKFKRPSYKFLRDLSKALKKCGITRQSTGITMRLDEFDHSVLGNISDDEANNSDPLYKDSFSA